jgi:hypothetical protein
MSRDSCERCPELTDPRRLHGSVPLLSAADALRVETDRRHRHERGEQPKRRPPAEWAGWLAAAETHPVPRAARIVRPASDAPEHRWDVNGLGRGQLPSKIRAERCPVASTRPSPLSSLAERQRARGGAPFPSARNLWPMMCPLVGSDRGGTG